MSMQQRLAAAIYRQAASFSAWMLAPIPGVESILIHRSVSTGEVSFGRSDIDMVMVIDEGKAEDGEYLASLCQAVNRARRFNPALSHIDVYEPSGLASHARMDTFWASVERRMLTLLRGKPVDIPFAEVRPDHALYKFLLWVEWFFAIAIQQRDRRNLRKIALECWNAYASAAALIPEPYLLRSDMEAAARRLEGNLTAERLGEASAATSFVFDLAARLHRSRLPALLTLREPLMFEAVTAPLCLRRLFVVLPRADSPLPPEALVKGAFPCTPEYLDLLAHTKNAFIYWILPPELLELGMAPPSVSGFLHSCRFYGHSRFLLYPGFSGPGRSTQTARLALIRHAAEWASRGESPPAISQKEIQELTAAGAPTVDHYYRTEYGPVRRETRRIQELLRALPSAAGGV